MGDARTEVSGHRGRFVAGLYPDAPRKFWLFAWLAFLPFVAIRAENLAESDTFWQVRTGLLIMAEGRIPLVDPFSWTAGGNPWTVNSWAFNVLLALAYQAAGLVGVAFISSCFVAAIGGLVLYLARQLGATPFASAAVLLTGGPLLTHYLSARPQLVDYAAVLLLVIFLRRLVEEPKPLLALLAIGVLATIWVNLHAAALLGVAMVGASVVLVFMKGNTRSRTGWLVAALLMATLGALVNPYGVGLVAQTVQVRTESVVVTEWQPFNPTDPLQLVLFALGLVGLFIAAWRREVIFAACLVVAACGSAAAMRILPIFVLLALPILASMLSRGLVMRYMVSRRKMFARGASIFLVLGVVLALYNLPFFGRPDPTHFPRTAVKAIPSGCKLFNDYHLGGYVILERPDVLVSLDSRNDLYGAEMVKKSGQVLRGHVDLEGGLAGADCVLVRPTSGLANRLWSSPDWEMTSAESAAVLFLRRVTASP